THISSLQILNTLLLTYLFKDIILFKPFYCNYYQVTLNTKIYKEKRLNYNILILEVNKMPYYYDRDGEIILERMQDLYYKTGLMRPDSEKEYEIHNSLGIHSKNESKLKKIVRNDSIDNSNNKNN
ncbi:hypothetical protein KBC25_03995, partial [Candidatus Pacearchaeota archaeon]|nr:hypothetical protein [Candidatus Pacearchaeota archaeon]